jgi:hypothetical protein
MTNLEFGIGKIKLNHELIRYEGSSPYQANHKFLVEAIGSKVLIYSCVASRHRDVASFFSLRGRDIVGGGSLYINRNSLLTLDDFSQDYGRIPSKAAMKFAELIYPELYLQGVLADGIMPLPGWSYMFDIRSFWDGFEY